MLICSDVQRSISFYSDVLGFEVVDRMDDVGLTGWASMRRGSNRLMLASPSYVPMPIRNEEGSLKSDVLHYFHCENLEQIRRHLVAKQVEVSPFVVRFYGKKEIEFRDPDGRTLVFGEDTDDEPTPEPDS